MSKQCLEISQMQHLKELGVDTRTASLCWVCLNLEPYLSFYNKDYPQEDTKVVPAFTLQDILDLLPKVITKEEHCHYFEMCRNENKYYVAYYWLDNPLVEFGNEEFIDAAYEILCWVIENGYLEVK